VLPTTSGPIRYARMKGRSRHQLSPPADSRIAAAAQQLGDRGFYQIAFRVATPLTVCVGALGATSLVPGWYVYTGSAQRHLAARLGRHVRGGQARRWHIDYLRALLQPATWRVLPMNGANECALVDQAIRVDHATRLPRQFGASDCRCGGHLTHSPHPPSWLAQP